MHYNSNKVKRQWSQKALRGRHPHDLSQQYVDILVEASNKWLTNADLFAETKGLLTEIQDQVIQTRNYKKYRVIHKSVKHFKNSQQITTQRITVVLTPIERETLLVFFFFYIFHRCSMCPPLVIQQASVR